MASVVSHKDDVLPSKMPGMYVVKRSGRTEPVHFDKITSRIKKLCYNLDPNFVDPVTVSQKVCLGVYKGVTTSELDELAAETAASLSSQHPDYGLLAARIAVSNLHKNTKKTFSQVMTDLFEYKNVRTGQAAPLLSQEVYSFIMANKDRLDSAIVYDRDFTYDYFGFKTLERSYLLRLDGKVAERPQQMLLRVACGLHFKDIEAAIETYELLSNKWFTHASPTLFNAGTVQPQMSSCFLQTMAGDSIDQIYDTLKQCALISKYAGGIGLSVHNIRATGSYIRGTNGTSNGLVPMLRVFNSTARYVDQGGGKRKGSFAIYLEMWHADIESFLQLKKNTGSEEHRARDLFQGLWICDLFMQRVESNQDWSLFCPNEAPGLFDVWGDAFDQLYVKYEKERRARKVIKARDLWQQVLESQIETGGPYMLYKDSCLAVGTKVLREGKYGGTFESVRVEDLKIGDVLLDDLGKTCRVTAASEPLSGNMYDLSLVHCATGSKEPISKDTKKVLSEIRDSSIVDQIQVTSDHLLTLRMNYSPIITAEFERSKNRGKITSGPPTLHLTILSVFPGTSNHVYPNTIVFKDGLEPPFLDPFDKEVIAGWIHPQTGETINSVPASILTGDEKDQSQMMPVYHDPEDPKCRMLIAGHELNGLKGFKRSILNRIQKLRKFVDGVITASKIWPSHVYHQGSNCTFLTLRAASTILNVPVSPFIGESKAGRRVPITKDIVEKAAKTAINDRYGVHKRKLPPNPTREDAINAEHSKFLETKDMEKLRAVQEHKERDIEDAKVEYRLRKRAADWLASNPDAWIHRGHTLDIQVDEYSKLSPFHPLRQCFGMPRTAIDTFYSGPSIPRNPEKEMHYSILEPWVLGLWLADGENIRPRFFIGQHETNIITGLKEYGQRHEFKMSIRKHPTAEMVTVTFLWRGFGRPHPFMQAIKAFGLYKNKHIPNEYLFGPVDVRRAVLAGLIDGDGNRRKNAWMFTQSKPHEVLWDQTIFLAQSLSLIQGAVPKYWKTVEKVINGIQTKSSFKEIRMCGPGQELVPCLQKPLKPYLGNPRLKVFAVPAVQPKKYVKISVDSPTNRFLIDGFLATHNCNAKSNYKHIGTIRSSNLCTEILEFSSPDEIAVCNLASIALPRYVAKDGSFDFKKLHEVTKVITRNLNKVIDINHYPVPEAKNSNMRHRPIGIGVQGLADTMALMRIPYESAAGKQLNRDIFEAIYFAALTSSNELAKKEGPYPSYKGSPASQGLLQFDMWGQTPSERWDWAGLKKQISESGLRNAMLVAPMPTASTSQILGYNESFEPWSSNIYVRRTLAGEFVCVNRYLLQDLIKRGLWNEKVRNMLIAHDGSVQKIPEIPDDLKQLYKTVWEIALKTQVDYAADRGAFIDQSQSFNVHMQDVTFKKLTSFHFYAWKKSLKTGMYYLRTRAAADAIKFTVDKSLLREEKTKEKKEQKAPTPALTPSSSATSLSSFDEPAAATPKTSSEANDTKGVSPALEIFDTKTNGISPSAVFDHQSPKAPESTVIDQSTAASAPFGRRPLKRTASVPSYGGEASDVACTFSCGS